MTVTYFFLKEFSLEHELLGNYFSSNIYLETIVKKVVFEWHLVFLPSKTLTHSRVFIFHFLIVASLEPVTTYVSLTAMHVMYDV